jgi:hypothetical protein
VLSTRPVAHENPGIPGIANPDRSRSLAGSL